MQLVTDPSLDPCLVNWARHSTVRTFRQSNDRDRVRGAHGHASERNSKPEEGVFLDKAGGLLGAHYLGDAERTLIAGMGLTV